MVALGFGRTLNKSRRDRIQAISISRSSTAAGYHGTSDYRLLDIQGASEKYVIRVL